MWKAYWLEDLTGLMGRQRNKADQVFTCLDGGLFTLIMWSLGQQSQWFWLSLSVSLRLGREDAEMGQFVHVMCRTELSLGKQMLEVSDYTNGKANDTSHLFLKTHQSQFYTLIFILLNMWPGRVDAIQEVPSCNHFMPIWKAPGQLRLDAHPAQLALSPIFSILFCSFPLHYHTTVSLV